MYVKTLAFSFCQIQYLYWYIVVRVHVIKYHMD